MEVVLSFFLGLLIASNIPLVRKFFSFEEFFWGMIKGLDIGESWKKKRKEKRGTKKE